MANIISLEHYKTMSQDQVISLMNVNQEYTIGSSETETILTNSLGLSKLGLLTETLSEPNIKTMGTTDVTVTSLILLALGILVMSGVYVYVGNWELKKLGIKQ